jgi:hypothetical protein
MEAGLTGAVSTVVMSTLVISTDMDPWLGVAASWAEGRSREAVARVMVAADLEGAANGLAEN